MLLFRCSFLILITLILQDAAAQNFAQVNQLPLHLNPSLAGAKGKKRISAGINKTGSEQHTEHNIALAYDQLSKKLHAGLGIYYKNHKKNDQQIAHSLKTMFPEEISKKSFFNQHTQQVLGLCIAPKYNMYYKNHPKKIKYTFSPSIFIEAGKECFSSVFNCEYKEYYTTVFSGTYPQGQVDSDSIHSRYKKYVSNNTFLNTGIGLQLNSGKFILLSRFTYSINSYNERITECTYTDVTSDEQSVSEKNLHRNLYAIESNIHMGYTFSKSKKSDFTFTPIAGIGIKQYVNMAPSSTSAEIYRNNVTNSALTQINYIHMSGNFRFKKILFGACYTRYFSGTYEGLTLGYQSDLMKLMVTAGHGVVFKKNTYKNIEITTDFFF